MPLYNKTTRKDAQYDYKVMATLKSQVKRQDIDDRSMGSLLVSDIC